MQKTFKRLAIILLALVATFCVAFSLTACTEKATDYKITVVYPDGKAVNGTTDGVNPLDENSKKVTVQICVVGASGETGKCFNAKQLGADGKVTIEAPNYTLKDGEKFKLQVNNVPDGCKCTEARIYTWSTYVTEPGNYTITLEAK